MCHWKYRSLAILAVLLVLPLQAGAASTFKRIDLSAPSGTCCFAYAVNHVGQVAGGNESPAGNKAFLWDPAGGMTELGVLPGGTQSTAHGLNDKGLVVGESVMRDGTRAFAWDRDGGMRELDMLPGGARSNAYGVNEHGQVAGFSDTPKGARAVLWTLPGERRIWGSFPGADTAKHTASTTGDRLSDSAPRCRGRGPSSGTPPPA